MEACAVSPKCNRASAVLSPQPSAVSPVAFLRTDADTSLYCTVEVEASHPTPLGCTEVKYCIGTDTLGTLPLSPFAIKWSDWFFPQSDARAQWYSARTGGSISQTLSVYLFKGRHESTKESLFSAGLDSLSLHLNLLTISKGTFE